MSEREDKVKKSYIFFLQKENDSEGFELSELLAATGWKASTVKTYFSKKWDSFLEKRENKYFVQGISQYSEVEYAKMFSQVNKNSQDPFKPVLDFEVERLVVKARESALLALDIYNRPVTLFRSEGFIVMMIIAWTALLHAIFQKKGIKYTWVKEDGSDEIIDGDLKAWEIIKCVKEFYGADNNAIRKNLEFIIGLRNKIEHRYVPAIDNHIGGECQSLLLNFDELLSCEFGNYFALKESMTFPLQTSNIREEGKMEVIKRFQGKYYEELKEYIETYRDALSEATYNDPKFSFRVYLIPKIGNHKSSSDLAFEFIKYDPNNKDDLDAYKRDIALIKERTKIVQVANQGKFKPKTIVSIVKDKIGKPFTTTKHTQAYKYYKVRPDHDNCKTQYCQYDEPHKDYVYTQEWVDFLVEKLQDEEEYQKVIAYK